MAIINEDRMALTYRFQEFLSSGTWTRPSSVGTVFVSMTGGGGGGAGANSGAGGAGGGSNNNPNSNTSGGAGGSGYCRVEWYE